MSDRPKIHPSGGSTIPASGNSNANLAHLNSFDTKLKKLADSIKVEDEDDEKQSLEQIRLTTKELFTNTIFGEVYNSVLLVISIFSCFQYLQQTYVDNPDEKDYVELTIAIIFTWDWILSCFIADHKMLFFTR